SAALLPGAGGAGSDGLLGMDPTRGRGALAVGIGIAARGVGCLGRLSYPGRSRNTSRSGSRPGTAACGDRLLRWRCLAAGPGRTPNLGAGTRHLARGALPPGVPADCVDAAAEVASSAADQRWRRELSLRGAGDRRACAAAARLYRQQRGVVAGAA